MVVDDNAKIFLRNLMVKTKPQLAELKREVDKKRNEVENVKRIRIDIQEGKDKRDEVEVVTAILSLQEELHRTDHKLLAAEVEISTIKSVVGDVTLGAKSHNFKPQTFKIPTNCDFCGERIWGLSAKGFDCKDCGYTCHSKCEMKVPATCPGEQTKEEKKKLKAERQEASQVTKKPPNGDQHNGASELPALNRSNTMNSLSSGYAANAKRSVSGPGTRTPTDDSNSDPPPAAKPAMGSIASVRKNRIIAPPPVQSISELPAEEPVSQESVLRLPDEQTGRMVYSYQASMEGEITVEEGDEVTVLEPDGTLCPIPSRTEPSSSPYLDGTGWMKVRAGRAEGLIPASYVELEPVPAKQLLPPQRPDSTYSTSSASLASSAAGGTTAKKKGPAVAPKKGAKKLHHVQALYDYEARSEAEWSMREGDRFVLVTRDAGAGWSDVEKGGVVKSVPANYIRDVS